MPRVLVALLAGLPAIALNKGALAAADLVPLGTAHGGLLHLLVRHCQLNRSRNDLWQLPCAGSPEGYIRISKVSGKQRGMLLAAPSRDIKLTMPPLSLRASYMPISLTN
jgi:hypothetical protein